MTALLKTIIGTPKFDPRKYGRKHTPDILQLEQLKRHLVFLPCNVQKGKTYHHFVKDAKPYGSGYTRRKFITYVKDLGKESFPIHLPTPERFVVNGPTEARVYGQLYFCDTETLSEKLDNFKLNGVEFQRQLVEILFPYREPYKSTDRDSGVAMTLYTNEMVHILSAWMYVGIDEYWSERLDGYSFKRCPVKQSRRKWLTEYYEFE